MFFVILTCITDFKFSNFVIAITNPILVRIHIRLSLETSFDICKIYINQYIFICICITYYVILNCSNYKKSILLFETYFVKYEKFKIDGHVTIKI